MRAVSLRLMSQGWRDIGLLRSWDKFVRLLLTRPKRGRDFQRFG